MNQNSDCKATLLEFGTYLVQTQEVFYRHSERRKAKIWSRHLSGKAAKAMIMVLVMFVLLVGRLFEIPRPHLRLLRGRKYNDMAVQGTDCIVNTYYVLRSRHLFGATEHG
ncbi:hypothetical protein E4U55_006704 [Claviceps digitariae]|nr:hypothetical protein E4U55_006704 [Claviceps digitariae]